MNFVNITQFGYELEKIEFNLIDINEFIFDLNSKKIRKDLSKQIIPDGLIDSVKDYLKENYPTLIQEAMGSPENKNSLSEILSNYISSEQITEKHRGTLGDISHKELINKLTDLIAGFGPIDKLFSIETLTDISLNNPESIWIDDYVNGPEKTSIQFESKEEYESVINKILNESGKSLSYVKPQASGSLPAFRFDIVGFDLSDSITCSLRIHTKKCRINEESIIKTNQASKEMLAFFREIMKIKTGIVVSGATGTGKTELMKFLAGYNPYQRKIITIEDVPELYLAYNYPHLNIVEWTTRSDVTSQEALYDLGTMVKIGLRHYPGLFVIGETRGREMFFMKEAAETGHGILTGLHTDEAEEQIPRMINLLKQYDKGQNDEYYGKELVRRFPIAIQNERVGKNQIRTINRVIEFTDYIDGTPIYNTLFEYDHKLGRHVQKDLLSEKLTRKLANSPLVNLNNIKFMIQETKVKNYV